MNYKQDHPLFNIFDNIVKYIDEILEKTVHEIKIVSVGSGNGTHEYDIQYLLKKTYGKDMSIICVDPNPESYKKYPNEETYIKPKYSYVDDLIKDEAIVGNCILLLVWPDPDAYYDLEAIMKLTPRHVITSYDFFGSGGSKYLHTWLKMNKCPTIQDNMVCEKAQKDFFEKFNEYKHFNIMCKYIPVNGLQIDFPLEVMGKETMVRYTVIWLCYNKN